MAFFISCVDGGAPGCLPRCGICSHSTFNWENLRSSQHVATLQTQPTPARRALTLSAHNLSYKPSNHSPAAIHPGVRARSMSGTSLEMLIRAGIAQSVLRLATSWTVRGSNPGGGEIFRTCPDWPWGPPSLLHNEYRVFTGSKVAGEWCWPPTPSSAEVKEQVELYLYSPSGPSWPVIGRNLPLPYELPRHVIKQYKSLAPSWLGRWYSDGTSVRIPGDYSPPPGRDEVSSVFPRQGTWRGFVYWDFWDKKKKHIRVPFSWTQRTLKVKSVGGAICNFNKGAGLP